jgi:uncharacterized membrane protein YkvA (DUF1232 family)
MKNKNNTVGFFQGSWNLIKALFNKKTPILPKIVGFLILAYILVPIDFLPGFMVPFFGWLDDATLAGLGLFIISKLVPKEIQEEKKEV